MRTFASLVIPALLLVGCGGSGSHAGAGFTIDRAHVKDNHGNFRGPPFETLAYWTKPFLVMSWTSNCATCDAQLANLEKLAADGKIPVIILNKDPVASHDALTPLATSRGYKAVHILRSTHDPVQIAQKDIDSNMFQAADPGMTYLYNSVGHQVWVMRGVADFESPEVQKLIAEAK